MPKFDREFSEKLDQLGKEPSMRRRRTSDSAADATAAPSPVEYKKVTFHNRADLHERLQQAIDKIAYEKGVRLSQAILIRYALATLLDSLDRDPEALLAALAQFEQAEMELSSERYPVNKGLQEYS